MKINTIQNPLIAIILSPTSEEENLEVVCVESTNTYLIYEEEELLKFKEIFLFELDDVSMEK
jgi:hypothetical protein